MEELLAAASAEHGETARHHKIEIAGYPARRQGHTRGSRIRRASPADEDAALRGADGAGRRIDGALTAEDFAEGDEAVIGRDDHSVYAALRKARYHPPPAG